MSALDAEVLVCPAEEYSRCDLIGPTRVGFPHHHCEYDEDHSGEHECACGYRWPKPEED